MKFLDNLNLNTLAISLKMIILGISIYEFKMINDNVFIGFEFHMYKIVIN